MTRHAGLALSRERISRGQTRATRAPPLRAGLTQPQLRLASRRPLDRRPDRTDRSSRPVRHGERNERCHHRGLCSSQRRRHGQRNVVVAPRVQQPDRGRTTRSSVDPGPRQQQRSRWRPRPTCRGAELARRRRLLREESSARDRVAPSPSRECMPCPGLEPTCERAIRVAWIGSLGTWWARELRGAELGRTLGFAVASPTVRWRRCCLAPWRPEDGGRPESRPVMD
jgi:hypothetical protein